MTRETFIDRRRVSNAQQGESATLKPGETTSTCQAIAKAARKHYFPSPWQRRPQPQAS